MVDRCFQSTAIFAIMAVMTAATAAAGEYYVAPNGDDGGKGTKSAPWRTIGKAAATLKPGDTVNIREGVYRERVVPGASGEEGKPITYRAYKGEKPVIDGTGVDLTEWTGLIDIESRHHIIVEGLTIRNGLRKFDVAGIKAEKCGDLVIRGNRTIDTASSGIMVWRSRNVVIDGNEVTGACNDGSQECITVAITDGFEISNNNVHHNGPGNHGGEGIDAKDGSSNGKICGNHVHDNVRLGIYADSWDKHEFNIEIFNNVVHDCSVGLAVAAENGGLLENVRIYNNLAYKNKHDGIVVAGWGEPVPHHPIKDVWIVNNTLYHNGLPNWGAGIMVENSDATGIVIRNNLLVGNETCQISQPKKQAGVTIDHNLLDSYHAAEDEIKGNAPVEGKSLLRDPEKADFHLMKGSAAAGAGSPDGAPPTDYDGHPRPKGGPVALGAFEP